MGCPLPRPENKRTRTSTTVVEPLTGEGAWRKLIATARDSSTQGLKESWVRHLRAQRAVAKWITAHRFQDDHICEPRHLALDRVRLQSQSAAAGTALAATSTTRNIPQCDTHVNMQEVHPSRWNGLWPQTPAHLSYLEDRSSPNEVHDLSRGDVSPHASHQNTAACLQQLLRERINTT
jgi:hypothetical protein